MQSLFRFACWFFTHHNWKALEEWDYEDEKMIHHMRDYRCDFCKTLISREDN